MGWIWPPLIKKFIAKLSLSPSQTGLSLAQLSPSLLQFLILYIFWFFKSSVFFGLKKHLCGSFCPKKCRKADEAACKDPTKVIFHRRSSSTQGCLAPMVVFQQKSSSTEGRLQPMVVFHWKLFCTKGRLAPKVVIHRKSSSNKGCLPSKVFFHQS